MAFDKDEIQQLDHILTRKFDEQHSALVIELLPLKEDLAYVKHRLDELYKMENEDVEQAFGEIEALKKKVKQLEHRLTLLEH